MTEEMNRADEYETLTAVVEGIVDPPLQRVKQQVSDELGTLRFELENQFKDVEDAQERITSAIAKGHEGLQDEMRQSGESSKEALLESVRGSRDLITAELRTVLQHLTEQADSRAESLQVAMAVRGGSVERVVAQAASSAQAQRLTLHEQLTAALEKLTSLETRRREDRERLDKLCARLNWMVIANLVLIGTTLAVLMWHTLSS